MESPASKLQTVKEKDRVQRENVASMDEHQVEAPALLPLPTSVHAPAPELEPEPVPTHVHDAPAHAASAHDAHEPSSVHSLQFPLPSWSPCLQSKGRQWSRKTGWRGRMLPPGMNIR